jgi:superfamily II DNA/RNA helicase
VHRIGRTGRAGASGEAISLVDGDEEKLLKEIEKLLKREFPRERAAATPATHRHSAVPSPARKAAPSQRPAKDEWFNKPYEPSPVSTVVEPPPFRQSKSRRQIAALLGGLTTKS